MSRCRPQDLRNAVGYRKLFCEKLGEGEGTGRLIILAQQIQPLDRDQDGFGDGVTHPRIRQYRNVGRVGQVARSICTVGMLVRRNNSHVRP